MSGKGILMSRFKKSFISIALVLSVIISLCGCNKAGKKNEEAIALASNLAEAVRSGDAANIMSFIDDPEVTEDDIKEIILPSDSNHAQGDYFEAVRATTSFQVSAAEYDKERKTSLVTVLWTQGDIYSEGAASAENIQDLKTALNQTRSFATYVVVDQSGDFPKIKEAKNVVDSVYSYTSEDNRIMPGKLADFYTDGAFVLAPKGTYSNTDSIGVRLNFSKDLMNYRLVPGVIYTVAKGDKVLYVSDVIFLEENSIRLDFNAGIAGVDCLNADGFINDGEYTIMVFDEYSGDLASFKCTVANEDIEKEEISFADHKNDYYLSSLVYEFKDSDLMANTFVYKSGWWDYDGTSVGKSAFASNTKTLGFSLAVSPNNESELFYEYYFSEKSDFGGVNEEEPVFQSSCKPSLYDDQACYDLDFTPEELKPGYYGLVVYSDASRKHIVFTAACLVVKETSGDVIG